MASISEYEKELIDNAVGTSLSVDLGRDETVDFLRKCSITTQGNWDYVVYKGERKRLVLDPYLNDVAVGRGSNQDPSSQFYIDKVWLGARIRDETFGIVYRFSDG